MLILKILLTSVAVLITCYLLSGIHVRSFGKAIIVAIVLGLINATLGSFLHTILSPVTWITLGLFSLVINGFSLWLVGKLVDGFEVKGFLWAVIGAVVLSFVNGLLDRLII